MNSTPIEDYALIGDRVTAALVSRDGSIDWLCLPRFDSGACFAALLGTPEHGRWLIRPDDPARAERAYRDGTLVLETVWHTRTGTVALIDFMVPEADHVTLVRIVDGRDGHVAMSMDLALRFDYGLSVPWVTRLREQPGVEAVAGPDRVRLFAPVKIHGAGMRSVAHWTVRAGERMAFVLTHAASHLASPPPVDAEAALVRTTSYWEAFCNRGHFTGPWAADVKRSVLTLEALTYAPSGGIVAAPTTSLPEQIGGGRNWDYRYCWLRDASLTLYALMSAGYTEEAARWRDWLQRSIAGAPSQVQIMYGLHGERTMNEWEVRWLPGYEGSSPVRIGNGAAEQLQIDVFGEVLDCLHQARRHGLRPAPHGWALQSGIAEHLANIWRNPDRSMWEIRGEPRHFTWSKIMAWVALDRMVHDATRHHLAGPLDRWRALRDEIHDTVLRQGYDSERNTFVQYFGGKGLDASLLLIPAVGFLPADDPRFAGTVAAVERELMEGGFVMRYRTEEAVDGLPPGEGAFLACTFWLVEAYARMGRAREAESTFQRLLLLRNDVGLLAEEYDVKRKRQVGNFPQAFSHIALVSAATTLSRPKAAGRNGQTK